MSHLHLLPCSAATTRAIRLVVLRRASSGNTLRDRVPAYVNHPRYRGLLSLPRRSGGLGESRTRGHAALVTDLNLAE